MAWVGGRWLYQDEREDYLKAIEERLLKLRAVIKAGKQTEHHIDLLEKDVEEYKRVKRIHMCESDMLLFFYEYFSEARNEGNPDNLVPTPDYDMDKAPDFHIKLCGILNTVSNINTTARIAWAASRGHAKSAYLSNAFPVHQIVYRKRKMILVISETAGGSAKFIRWCSGQLKYNDKLRADFGELLYTQKSRNEKDSENAFLTTTNIKMESTSLGMQIRGFRNGSVRPDLIILDDLESQASNNTPELRAKAKSWLNADLLPAGDPTRTAVLFMGTIVHYDSLLNYVLNSPERGDFIKNKFPAVINPPERQDLWDEFTELFKNYKPTDEELRQVESGEMTDTPNKLAAIKFYEENKEEMDKGIQVLWGSRFPYHSLMLEKISIGTKAFNTEFMNNPIDEESQIFKPEDFTYYDQPIDEFTHKNFTFHMGVDFAMGKEKGDYSAIVIVARHRVTKKLYIIDAWGDRIHPDKFLSKIVEKVMKYQVDNIAAESQMAQEFFVDRLKMELQANGYPATRVKKIQQRQRKELRIEALQPDIENGTILFNRRHSLLLEHFERYGSGWYDDLPDACEMAISISKNATKQLKNKPSWM